MAYPVTMNGSSTRPRVLTLQRSTPSGTPKNRPIKKAHTIVKLVRIRSSRKDSLGMIARHDLRWRHHLVAVDPTGTCRDLENDDHRCQNEPTNNACPSFERHSGFRAWFDDVGFDKRRGHVVPSTYPRVLAASSLMRDHKWSSSSLNRGVVRVPFGRGRGSPTSITSRITDGRADITQI